MARKFGGVKVTARRVSPDGDTPRSRYPEWVKEVLPNHEATLARAKLEAEAMLAAGEPCLWICRSRHKLAGVVEHRYYVLTEDVVRLLGGYIPDEVLEFREQPSAKEAREKGQSDRENPGRVPGKPPGRKPGRNTV